MTAAHPPEAARPPRTPDEHRVARVLAQLARYRQEAEIPLGSLHGDQILRALREWWHDEHPGRGKQPPHEPRRKTRRSSGTQLPHSKGE